MKTRDRIRDSAGTILVTGVGSNIGQGIVKALRLSGMKQAIIGTDMLPMSAGLYRCDKGYVVPSAGSPGWLDSIMDICGTEGVRIVLIGSDPEVPFFAGQKELIERTTGSRVLVSGLPLVKAMTDKWETSEFLERHSLHCPKSLPGRSATVKEVMSVLKFPMLVKPRKGAGSRNVFVVRGERELECALTFAEDPLVQEYIGGEEFTSGVFFDRTSALRGVITMKRELQAGTTYRAIVDDFPEVREAVLGVAAALSAEGAVGPMNIQSKYFEGKTYTFEINPRFSGTTVFRAKFNFNEPEMAVRHFLLGEEVPEMHPSRGIVMRYWEEVYASIESLEELRRTGSSEKPPSEILRLL